MSEEANVTAGDGIRVVKRDEWGAPLPVVTGGEFRPAIWPGMGARTRSMHYITLPAGAGTVPLVHPSEAVYYVLSGSVDVEDVTEEAAPRAVGPGGMFHIDPGTKYVMTATLDGTVVIGGPCPADDSLYEMS